jgi:hypothetical protein
MDAAAERTPERRTRLCVGKSKRSVIGSHRCGVAWRRVMKTAIRKSLLGAGLAGAVAMAAPAPASAGSVPANPTLVKMTAGQQLTDVRWRRSGRHYGYRYGRSGCTIEGGYHRQMTC